MQRLGLWRWTGIQELRRGAIQTPELSRTSTSNCNYRKKRLYFAVLLNIWASSDFLDSSSPSFTSIPPAAPAYQLNTSQICGGASTMFTPVFRTVTKLLGTDANPQLSTPRSSLQEYPFDVYAQISLSKLLSLLLSIVRYSGRIAMYAVDHTTGAFISLNVTRSYGIAVYVTPFLNFLLCAFLKI